MSAPLSHDEAFAMLPELALGMLPADEAARVMAVVRTSPTCQAELSSLRAAAGTLDASVAPNPMAPARKAAMRERLLTRASTGSDAPAPTAAPEPHSPVHPPALRIESGGARSAVADVPRAARTSGVARFVPWFAAAASIGVALAQLQSARAAQSARDAAQAALTTATAASTQLAAQLASRDSLVAAMTGAQVRVVELVSTAKLPPGARMFWDRVSNRWTLVTHDLSPAQSGRVYQLWLVTAKSEKISAGTFNTDARGRAVVQATYALAEADLAAIAITEEPVGGSPQPTGAILIAGAPTR